MLHMYNTYACSGCFNSLVGLIPISLKPEDLKQLPAAK